MARRKTLLQLLDEMTPEVRAAFIQVIQNIKDDVILADLIAALERRDIEAAIRAIPLGAEYLAPLDRAILTKYRDGGEWAATTLTAMAKAQGARVAMRFDVRNPRAERFVAEMSSRLITEVLEATKEDVRRVLTMGMRSGTAPRTAALDLVGRSPSPGRPRRGGIIGLRTDQMQQSEKVIAILSDPARIHEYFVRDAKTGKLKPRFPKTDRRYDAKVKRAIREGRALDRADMRALTTLHRNRMLRDRGETIARTELLGSLSHAQDESLRQLVDRGDVGADAVESTWDASSDGDTRDTHRAADGQVRKLGEPFDVGGYPMMFPGDSTYAPAKETVNCRCIRRVSISFVSSLNPGD